MGDIQGLRLNKAKPGQRAALDIAAFSCAVLCTLLPTVAYSRNVDDKPFARKERAPEIALGSYILGTDEGF